MEIRQPEIKEFSTEELKEKLRDLESRQSSLRLAHEVTPLDNPLQLRKLRRTIARLKTELTKRELQ